MFPSTATGYYYQKAADENSQDLHITDNLPNGKHLFRNYLGLASISTFSLGTAFLSIGVNTSDPSWLWVWVSMSIGYYFIGGNALLGAMIIHFCTDLQANKHRECLAAPAVVEWSPTDYTSATWEKFVEEEWGWGGRSAFKYDSPQVRTVFRIWSILFVLWTFFTLFVSSLQTCFGKAGEGIHFTTFSLLSGIGNATFLCTTAVGIVEMSVRWTKSKMLSEGPQYLKITHDGYLIYGNTLYEPKNILARRVNNYGLQRTPCLEIAFHPFVFVPVIRQPLPENTNASELEAQLQKLGLCVVSENTPLNPKNVWRSILSGYALDLEPTENPEKRFNVIN